MSRNRMVLGDREFRALWLAQVVSLVGDRLAEVALAVLVFERAGSPPLTALAYALVNLPWLIGGPLLSSVVDRLPRRAEMVVCDGARTLLIGAMAVPGIPLLAMFALVLAACLFGPPFGAARASTMPDVFDDPEAYVAAAAVGNATIENTQIAGFAVGGVMVATFGSHVAPGLDAASFAASGLLVGDAGKRPPVARGRHGASRRMVVRAARRLPIGVPRPGGCVRWPCSPGWPRSLSRRTRSRCRTLPPAYGCHGGWIVARREPASALTTNVHRV